MMRSRSTWRGLVRRCCGAALSVSLVACTLLVAGVARAEGGEIFFRLDVANEAALLHHPGVQYAVPGGAWAYVPRFELSASYGISHLFYAGLGVGSSLPRDLVAHNVVVQGYAPGSLYTNYLAVVVPVAVGFHVGRGGDWSGEIGLSGGPAFSLWDARSLENAAGTRVNPIKPFRDWYTEWFGRVSVRAEWRPENWGALSVGSYVGMSSARDVYVGVVAEGTFVWTGAGPFVRTGEM